MDNIEVKRPIKVLHILIGYKNLDGVARFVKNYYHFIDQRKVIFDFVFCRENTLQPYEKENVFSNSSITALYISSEYKRFSIISYYKLKKAIVNKLKMSNYDIVHINSGAVVFQLVCLYAAIKQKIPIRISHSHGGGKSIEYGKMDIREFIKNISSPLLHYLVRNMATDLFACSKSAGKNLFGNKGVHSDNFRIIKNAIDVKKYTFSNEKREIIRKNKNIYPHEIVIAHIGRVDKNKNQKFTIDVFCEICKITQNARLWIIGDGVEIDIIKKKVEELMLCEKITFYGASSNVEELLQGVDAVVLPSIHEGLSIVAIEAQTSGLPVFLSDTLSVEHDITGNVTFIPLSESASKWAEIIIRTTIQFKRMSVKNRITSAGYDISTEAYKLEKFYISAINR